MFNKIPQCNNHINTPSCIHKSIFLQPADNNELIRQLNSLKNNISPGPDGIQKS